MIRRSGYLKTYGLDFFINKMKLANPLDWHRAQHTWGRYLLNKDDRELKDELRVFDAGDVKAAKVLRYIVNEINRFMKYLHLKRPEEVPLLTFVPISKAAYKEHDARRKMTTEVFQAKYINPADWVLIQQALEKRQEPWRFAIYLAYYYGLRRNEALGLKLEDIRKAYLSVERQFVGTDVRNGIKYGPLKNRTSRKVPHLFLSQAKTFEYIEGMKKCVLHPDTLSGHFSALASELNLQPYVFHDLRRAFITNAIRKGVEPENLRLAVGHSTIQTTYKFYVMDSREFEDDIWKPDERAA